MFAWLAVAPLTTDGDKGRTDKLPQVFTIVETYRHDNWKALSDGASFSIQPFLALHCPLTLQVP
jgi:hypothetical protein